MERIFTRCKNVIYRLINITNQCLPEKKANSILCFYIRDTMISEQLTSFCGRENMRCKIIKRENWMCETKTCRAENVDDGNASKIVGIKYEGEITLEN